MRSKLFNLLKLVYFVSENSHINSKTIAISVSLRISYVGECCNSPMVFDNCHTHLPALLRDSKILPMFCKVGTCLRQENEPCFFSEILELITCY